VTARSGISVVVRWPLVGVLALLALPLLVASSRAADDGVVPGSDPAAARLLERAAAAESVLGYRAVEVVSDTDGDGGQATAVLTLSHVPGRGTLVLEDASATTPSRAGLAQEGSRRPELLVPLLQRSYRLALGGTTLVAGRPATVVLAERPDGGTAARFWVDDRSGLLLRRQVLDRWSRVVSSQSLMRVWLSASPAPFLPPLLPSVGTPSLSGAAAAAWCDRGWPCPARLGPLTLFDVRTVQGSATTALHLTYSDGLSTVSVFVERGRLQVVPSMGTSKATVGGHVVLERGGVPSQLIWAADGYVLTVVSDAPRDVDDQVVAELPHGGADTSAWARLQRGAGRVLSWLNPFG